MTSENSLLRFSLVILKILTVLMSVLLFLSILMLIITGDGMVLLPGLGLIVKPLGIAILFAAMTVVLLISVFLFSKFIKPLR